jgi:transposase, IS5 family
MFSKEWIVKRIKQDNKLFKIDQIINWHNVETLIGKVSRSGTGPTGYSYIMMTKALILQQWHNLSDPKLEEALNVRLDFILFTGFKDKVPDETTLCRFRNRLIELNLLDKILQELNNQLELHGLKIKASQGAILDATIIESAARPSKEIEGIVIDREEDKTVIEYGELSESADPDARWLKKGKRSYFGYKEFVTTDVEDGYITHVHTTSANKSEVKELPAIVKNRKIHRLYADKGYASQTNRDLLIEQKIKRGIMYKAQKGKPLTYLQKFFNKKVSSVRYKVEQAFGTLKRVFSFKRASYFGLEKVHGQMIMKSICFNLLKAINKIHSFS